MRDRRPLPALDKAKKLQSPDLNSIGDKNYTDTILKYGGLATRFVQLDTNAKTIVAAINELYYRPTGSIVIPNPPLPSGGILETQSGLQLTTESGEPLEIEGGSSAPSLTSIGIDGDVYKIEGGSGGSTVIPNPSELPTDLLYSVKIDSNVFAIAIPALPDIRANYNPDRPGVYVDFLRSFYHSDYGSYANYIEVITTLYSGDTTVYIPRPSRLPSSISSEELTLDVYTSKYGIDPTNITLSSDTFILTFNEQAEDIEVKVRFS